MKTLLERIENTKRRIRILTKIKAPANIIKTEKELLKKLQDMNISQNN